MLAVHGDAVIARPDMQGSRRGLKTYLLTSGAIILTEDLPAWVLNLPNAAVVRTGPLRHHYHRRCCCFIFNAQRIRLSRLTVIVMAGFIVEEAAGPVH